MSRGAASKFDRDEVLERAMLLFWEQGYEGTGLSELLERMGIGRQSLYNTFGDKRTLFLEALDHYCDTRMDKVRGMLEAPGSPLQNIRQVLKHYVEHCNSGNNMGCFVVNSMANSDAGDTQEFAEALKSKVKISEKLFREAFERAKEAGEIQPDAESLALARSISVLSWGLALMGRVGMSKATVRDAVAMHMKIIDSVQVS